MFVRQAAIEAIAQLAERGDPVALKVVISRIHDERSQVRVAAIRTLTGLAERGDHASLAALARRRNDRDIWVRRFASEALNNLSLTNSMMDLAIEQSELGQGLICTDSRSNLCFRGG